MTPPADTLAGAHPLIDSSSGEVTSSELASRTDADLDVADALHALQVEEVAYRATLQALERPLLGGLRHFLG